MTTPPNFIVVCAFGFGLRGPRPHRELSPSGDTQGYGYYVYKYNTGLLSNELSKKAHLGRVMGEFETGLTIINGTYFLLGCFFAWQIYLAPSPHGYTQISVAVGTLIWVTDIMCNVVIFYHFKSLSLPTYLALPVFTLATVGGPMFVSQVYRKWREDRRNDKYINNRVLDNEQSLD